MALQKGGPGAGKVRGGHYLCPKKRQLKQVLAYKRLVIKKVLVFQFFPKNRGVLQKKKVLTSISSPFLPIFPQKSWCSPKKKSFLEIYFKPQH